MLAISFAAAATPNPGHDAGRIGAGTFSNGNYTFPNSLAVNGTVFYVNSSSGNVGIGTITPSSKLHVQGTLHSTGAARIDGILGVADQLTLDVSGTPRNAIGVVSTSMLRIGFPSSWSATEIYGGTTNRIDLWGNLYLNGSAGNPASTFRYIGQNGNTNDIAFNVPTGGKYAYRVAGTEVVSITTGGDVGVGTASPEAKLHVNGDILLSGSSGTGNWYVKDSGSSTLSIGSNDTTKTVQLEIYHSTNPVSLGIDYDGGSAYAYIESVHSSYANNTFLSFRPGGTETWRVGSYGSSATYPTAFIVKPAAESYDFFVANTTESPLFYVDTSARSVGVGTATPDAPLEIVGTVSNRNTVFTRSGGGQQWAINLNNDDFQLESITDGTQPFRINDLAPTSSLEIDSAGFVGLGTSSPTQKLHVGGSANITSAVHTPQICLNGDCQTAWPTGTIDGSGVANSAAFWTDADTLAYDGNFTWDNGNKRLGIGTTSPSSKLHVLTSTDGNDTILKLTSADGGWVNGQELQVDFAQSSTSVARIAGTYFGSDWGINLYGYSGGMNAAPVMSVRGNGRVGINTTSPSYSLDVSGTGRFAGALTAASITSSSGLTVSSGTVSLPIDQIQSAEIQDSQIMEVDLNATNSPSNGYVLAYNSTTGGFSWAPDQSGTGTVTGTGNAGYLAYWTSGSNIDDDSELSWDATSNRLTIGNVAATTALTVGGSLYNANLPFMTTLFDTGTAYNNATTAPGGGIMFAGQSDMFFGYEVFGGVRGLKENTVSGNTNGVVAIYTRTNGESDVNEAARFTSGGRLGINTTAPNYTIDVSGTGRFGSTLTAAGITSSNGLTVSSGTVDFPAGSIPGDDIAAGTVDASEIEDNTITEADLLVTGAVTDNYVLAYNQTSGGFYWKADENAGGNMSGFYLATSDTVGNEQITDGEVVNVTGGTGITVTRTTNIINVTSTLGTAIEKGEISNSGTLSFDWANDEIADALTVSGGTLGANSVSGTWATTGTLTVGDGGDRIDIASSTWDVTNGVITGATLGSASVSSAAVFTTLGTWTLGDGGDRIDISSSSWDVTNGALTGLTGLTVASGTVSLPVDQIQSAEIQDSQIMEADLNVTNSPSNGQILSYNSTTGGFTWTADVGGTIDGSGSASHIAYWSDGDTLTYDSSQLYWDGTSNRLGIGSAAPTQALHVTGSANITGTVHYGGNLTGYGADFAERFTVAEDVGFGDVVCLREDQRIERCSQRAQSTVVGVVSTAPTIIGNAGAPDSVAVGIVGIVPTKVVGPVRRGDLLAASSRDGYAEKASVEDFGAIIGKAMESCSGSCTVDVLIGLR